MTLTLVAIVNGILAIGVLVVIVGMRSGKSGRHVQSTLDQWTRAVSRSLTAARP